MSMVRLYQGQKANEWRGCGCPWDLLNNLFSTPEPTIVGSKCALVLGEHTNQCLNGSAEQRKSWCQYRNYFLCRMNSHETKMGTYRVHCRIWCLLQGFFRNSFKVLKWGFHSKVYFGESQRKRKDWKGCPWIQWPLQPYKERRGNSHIVLHINTPLPNTKIPSAVNKDFLKHSVGCERNNFACFFFFYWDFLYLTLLRRKRELILERRIDYKCLGN